MTVVLDFAALPPEVNSARMYAGAGAAPLMAAATAWDELAAELNTAASSYHGVISELTGGQWTGPSSTSMSAAAAPYLAWMSTTAAQAEQTANQVRSAAAAYQAAFMATVPPPVVAANRATLAALVATNILGQNTPAIAATEAQYGEMWAQDAAAMYGYAGAAAAATKVSPFSPAPHNTNPDAAAAQGAAVSHASASSTANAVPNLLQNLANGLAKIQDTISGSPISNLNGLAGSTGEYALVYASSAYLTGGILAQEFPLMALALPAAAAEASAVSPAGAAGLGSTLVSSYGSGASASGLAGLGATGGAGVSAGLGESASVGKLSVPPSWGTASPAIRLAATAMPLDGLSHAAAAAPGGLYGGAPLVGPVGSIVNAPRNGDPAPRGLRSKVLPAEVGNPGGHGRSRPARPQHGAREGVVGLGEQEHEELEQLRRQLAEVAMERDAAARLLREAIKQ